MATKIYLVKYEHQAQAKIYFVPTKTANPVEVAIVTYEHQADIKVYPVKYEHQASIKGFIVNR